jgi:uncharacterized protein (TIGR02757 family)
MMKNKSPRNVLSEKMSVLQRPIFISKSELEQLYHENCNLEGKTDPIIFPHRYRDFHDVEVVAFISAVMAFGTVRQICSTLEKISCFLGPEPGNRIRELKRMELTNLPDSIYHRFYSPGDIAALLYALHEVYTNYGSIEALYVDMKTKNGGSYRDILAQFQRQFRDFAVEYTGEMTTGIKFMFPDPMAGSACKRLHLFLRWMVRSDAVDIGMWKAIQKSELLIPVDTHIETVAKRFGFTGKKIVSWGMAEEITGTLRRYDEADPVRYDFALCHSEIQRGR